MFLKNKIFQKGSMFYHGFLMCCIIFVYFNWYIYVGFSFFSSLASYGAFVRPMPYSNEVGLRMLIGGALREASVLGYRITPLFSYYSYHGPVFRVMLRMNRGKLPENR